MNTPGYESLANVLQRAYAQAAHGKGAERHAVARPFSEQPMQSISQLIGSHDGLLYQAMKKIQESKRMAPDAAVRELLGAINYLAGAVIFIETSQTGTENRVAELRESLKDIVTAANMVAETNPATGIRRTHWTCACGHDDIRIPVGEFCPICK